MLCTMQILADKRLVQELPNGRTPEQRYKEQCKMKYVIVLMKECYTSLEYDREINSRKIELKTLYQHWFVASRENLLVNPDHRVIARLNMGVHPHEMNGTAGNEDGDIHDGDIHDPLMQAREAHINSAQTRETARNKLSKLEKTLELDVQSANRARNMAFDAAKIEILKTQLSEENKAVEVLSCLRRDVANKEDEMITEDLDGEEAKPNEEAEAKANAEAKAEADEKANAKANEEAEAKERSEAKANVEARVRSDAKEKEEVHAKAKADEETRIAKEIENAGCAPNGFLLKSMFIPCSYSDVIVLE